MLIVPKHFPSNLLSPPPQKKTFGSKSGAEGGGGIVLESLKVPRIDNKLAYAYTDNIVRFFYVIYLHK